jgi:hydrogenase maturation protein HypF
MNVVNKLIRTRLLIRGKVQGVGFRPFIYALANAVELKGYCLNDNDGLVVEIEGHVDSDYIDGFIEEIKQQAPVLSRVDYIEREDLPPAYYSDFTIRESIKGDIFTSLYETTDVISPDIAPCKECLGEMTDPADRRYSYPFINCTQCGPRYSILRDIPYDRRNTTMSAFTMCDKCKSEYDDPESRRFHAQPNACAECGPALWIVQKGGETDVSSFSSEDVLVEVCTYLRQGLIIAVKGLGGFQLICDATNDEAVSKLRETKRGSLKPFAVMVASIDAANSFAIIDDNERELLESRQAPIVILDKKDSEELSEFVAPSTYNIGVMLPSTPLYHLIVANFTALVVTSGNLASEPIAIVNSEAIAKLSGIADYFLFHDREIQTRLDDSIVRSMGRGVDARPMMIRRARGYVPEGLPLDEEMGEILACGAEMKGTFTLVKGYNALISQHLGELSNFDSTIFFRETLFNLKDILGLSPKTIVRDMHPDYFTSSFAEEYRKLVNISTMRMVSVQHHHAHIAATMAEYSLNGLVVGVSLDGTGYGVDGHVWGCEFMLARRRDYCRRAHLSYIPMPGATKAVSEPWRMAVSYLYRAYGDELTRALPTFTKNIGADRMQIIVKLIRDRINTPITSSAGRLFDAVSALLGLSYKVGFEAEAALALENSAVLFMRKTRGESDELYPPYPYKVKELEMMELDVAPVIRAIVDELNGGTNIGMISARFHRTMAMMVVDIAARLAKESSLDSVVLSGGVFQNALLLRMSIRALKAKGLKVYVSEKVPVNDGGISFGQAVVAWEKEKVLRVLEIM